MTYRWLNGFEACDIINPLITWRNSDNPTAPPWVLLNSATAFAVGAFEDEFCIGYICLQLFPFLGPLFVEPIDRNGEISRQLVEEMVKVMAQMQTRGCLVICESPVTERMCKQRGMKRIDYPVYVSAEVA
jgi:hypothetical protein